MLEAIAKSFLRLEVTCLGVALWSLKIGSTNTMERQKLKFFTKLVLREIKQRPAFRKIVAFFIMPIGFLISYFSAEIGFNLLIKIFLSELSWFDRVVSKRLRTILPTIISHYYNALPEFSINNNHKNVESNYLVVKPYISGKEKGVISIHWRWQIDIFARNYDLESIFDRYIILLGADCFGAEFTLPFLSIMHKGKLLNGIVFTSVKNPRTKKRLELLGFQTVPYGISSDFVDHSVFDIIPAIPKTIDIIMVANWDISVKRQYILFKALEKISQPLEVAFIGFEGNNYTIKDLKYLECRYSIDQHNIHYHENLDADSLNTMINKSKIFIITSLMEGGNRACFESFFANVPAIILEENIGIPRDYFNSQTGRIVPENKLHIAILEMLNNLSRFTPRDWALKFISPIVTTKNINGFLRDYSLNNNMRWTTDIVVKKWENQSFTYMDHTIYDTFKEDYNYIKRSHYANS